MTTPSKVFISYSWEDEEHNQWVKELATKLREDGVDVKLDQWELTPGDQIPLFMERMVMETDYILIICTPKYKQKSDNREGGVGYEGDIMTGHKLSTNNIKKFIPILRKGDLEKSVPTWLKGTFAPDFRTSFVNYDDLKATLSNSQIKKAPVLGIKKERTLYTSQPTVTLNINQYKIEGVVLDEIGYPKNDGSAGSALYTIPFLLDGKPDRIWAQYFIHSWDHPTSFSNMHRPGIASIVGDKILLKGTTVEEVKDHHLKTLKSAVKAANERYHSAIRMAEQQVEKERKEKENLKNKIRDISKDLNFD